MFVKRGEAIDLPLNLRWQLGAGSREQGAKNSIGTHRRVPNTLIGSAGFALALVRAQRR